MAAGPGFVGGSLEPGAFLLGDGGGRGNVIGSARDCKGGGTRVGEGRMTVWKVKWGRLLG